jgi:hypothetical protein
MKLTISKPIPCHKNQYKFTINFMHGDADGESDYSIYVGKSDEAELIKFIEIIDKCKFLHDEIPEELAPYCDEDYEGDEEPKFYFEWPGDHTADYQFLAGWDGYSLTYFDENGHEYDVKIER